MDGNNTNPRKTRPLGGSRKKKCDEKIDILSLFDMIKKSICNTSGIQISKVIREF